MLRDMLIKMLGGFTKADFYKFATQKTEELNSSISAFLSNAGKIDMEKTIRKIHKVSVSMNTVVNGREMPQEVVKKEIARMLVRALFDECLIRINPLTGDGLIGEKYVNVSLDIVEHPVIIEDANAAQEETNNEK